MQNWTLREFEVYVFFFAAHCNKEETVEESNYILQKYPEEEFYKIHNEVVQDKEQTSILKITDYLREHKLSYAQKSELLKEVKEILFADGTVDAQEKETYSILQKILN